MSQPPWSKKITTQKKDGTYLRHLGANPWQCTCSLLWLSSFLIDRFAIIILIAPRHHHYNRHHHYCCCCCCHQYVMSIIIINTFISRPETILMSCISIRNVHVDMTFANCHDQVCPSQGGRWSWGFMWVSSKVLQNFSILLSLLVFFWYGDVQNWSDCTWNWSDCI